MNHIQTATTGLRSDSLEVEFYPSVDDYVHISSRISATIETPPTIHYAYQLFLLLNAVAFPAFLWFSDYYLIGVLILALNIGAISWLIPWFTRDGYRTYYKQVMGPRENKMAHVKLNSVGICYASDDAESFLPWRHITAIEETDESIFFFCAGNGFAVRKSGFAYRDEQDTFTRFARTHLEAAHRVQLER